MAFPDVVTREQWLAARTELLAAEKEATRSRDALNARRRQLPLVRIDQGRQLIIQHVMFGPSWEAARPGCMPPMPTWFQGHQAHAGRHRCGDLCPLRAARRATVTAWCWSTRSPSAGGTRTRWGMSTTRCS